MSENTGNLKSEPPKTIGESEINVAEIAQEATRKTGRKPVKIIIEPGRVQIFDQPAETEKKEE